MRVVCSYCRKEMGEKEPLEDASVSHGMCASCRDHFVQQWKGQQLGHYLDSFSEPVMVLSGEEQRIVAANQPMADLLGKSDRELFGLLGGEAIECVNARRTGGCGRTLHCKVCTIRNTVRDVLDTGESREHVPATIATGGGTIDFLVSARRLDSGAVEVRLEALSEAAQREQAV